MNLKQHKQQQLKNEKFSKEYSRFGLIFEIKQLWLEVRSWLKSKKKKKL